MPPIALEQANAEQLFRKRYLRAERRLSHVARLAARRKPPCSATETMYWSCRSETVGIAGKLIVEGYHS